MRSGLPLPANAVGRRLQIRQALNRNWPRLLLSSSGRIDRASWWIASCALTIVGAIVLKLIDIFDYDRVVAATNRFSAVSVGLVLVILFVLLLYCLLAVGVKRLHDRNKRGWWVFLFLLVPVVLAFMIGAVYAGLAGCLYASSIRFVSPDSFSGVQAVLLMTMLIVGGMGSIAGSIVGALTLTILPEVLRFLGQWYLVLYGLGVIVVIVLLPGGLASMIVAFPLRRAGAR